MLVLAVCAFAAGVIRGFSGFGLSAVFVASSTFFISPKQIIPIAQLLEVIASLTMLRSVWPHINWRWLRPLAIGYLFSVPVGAYVLANTSATALRTFGCVVMFVASSALLLNFKPKFRDGLLLRLSTGVLGGFMSGATSYGGMLASIMLFAVELPAVALRATLVMIFFMSSCYFLVLGQFNGLVTAQTFETSAWLILPLIAGIALGSRGFSLVTPELFKRMTLFVLLLLSIAGLILQ